MKTLMVLCFVAVVGSVCSIELKNIPEIVKKCQQEIGFQGNITTIKLTDAPQEAKCYLACVLKNKGVLKEDGSYDKELAKEYAKITPNISDEKKELMITATDECYNDAPPTNPDNTCETAYYFFTCRTKKVAKSENKN